MDIKLKRDVLNPDFTLGQLELESGWRCYTVEDAVRDGQKVDGRTAIPAGRYRVIITRSRRFKRKLPLLVDVPDFDGVRIHPGNCAADTEGCILPGLIRTADGVGDSRVAFYELYRQIEKRLNDGEEVWIEIA